MGLGVGIWSLVFRGARFIFRVGGSVFGGGRSSCRGLVWGDVYEKVAFRWIGFWEYLVLVFCFYIRVEFYFEGGGGKYVEGVVVVGVGDRWGNGGWG